MVDLEGKIKFDSLGFLSVITVLTLVKIIMIIKLIVAAVIVVNSFECFLNIPSLPPYITCTKLKMGTMQNMIILKYSLIPYSIDYCS